MPLGTSASATSGRSGAAAAIGAAAAPIGARSSRAASASLRQKAATTTSGAEAAVAAKRNVAAAALAGSHFATQPRPPATKVQRVLAPRSAAGAARPPTAAAAGRSASADARQELAATAGSLGRQLGASAQAAVPQRPAIVRPTPVSGRAPLPGAAGVGGAGACVSGGSSSSSSRYAPLAATAPGQRTSVSLGATALPPRAVFAVPPPAASQKSPGGLAGSARAPSVLFAGASGFRPPARPAEVAAAPAATARSAAASAVPAAAPPPAASQPRMRPFFAPTARAAAASSTSASSTAATSVGATGADNGASGSAARVGDASSGGPARTVPAVVPPKVSATAATAGAEAAIPSTPSAALASSAGASATGSTTAQVMAPASRRVGASAKSKLKPKLSLRGGLGRTAPSGTSAVEARRTESLEAKGTAGVPAATVTAAVGVVPPTPLKRRISLRKIAVAKMVPPKRKSTAAPAEAGAPRVIEAKVKASAARIVPPKRLKTSAGDANGSVDDTVELEKQEDSDQDIEAVEATPGYDEEPEKDLERSMWASPSARDQEQPQNDASVGLSDEEEEVEPEEAGKAEDEEDVQPEDEELAVDENLLEEEEEIEPEDVEETEPEKGAVAETDKKAKPKPVFLHMPKAKPATPATPSTPGDVADDSVCWNYVTGGCKRGDSCPYLHVIGRDAQAAAARSLARAGHGIMRGGGDSEAEQRLAELLASARQGKGVADGSPSPLDEKLEEDWKARCPITPGCADGESGTTPHILEATMDSCSLDESAILEWAFWLDAQLDEVRSAKDGSEASANAQRPDVKASSIDFSHNYLTPTGLRAVCAVLEKHSVRCEHLRLNGTSLCDEGLREITRYLVSLAEAPVLELHLEENPEITPSGLSWLLISLAMHPAYPTWKASSERFVPLRLHLGPRAAFERSEELDNVLLSVAGACNVSFTFGKNECSAIVNGRQKHNCIVELCSFLALGEEAPKLPAPPMPYSRSVFTKPSISACGVKNGSDGSSGITASPRILHMTDHVAVVYKPPGWVCQEQFDREALRPDLSDRPRKLMALMLQEKPSFVEWIIHQFVQIDHCEAIRDESRNFGLVHRLDAGTSGPLLVGTSTFGYDHVKKQLHDRHIVKDYLALVHGTFSEPRGSCNAKIDRSMYAETRRVRVGVSGEVAATLWEVLAEYQSPQVPERRYTLLHLRIHTGRTHQIRVHLAHLGHPIVSDWTYFESMKQCQLDAELCKRMFLHKFRVSFMDTEGQATSISCSLQMDNELWSALRKLRLVGGMALSGCGAPGLRNRSAEAAEVPANIRVGRAVAAIGGRLPSSTKR
eukprot:TRINITY_DN3712_c1_g1_i1.p1 TRINITY_DN3712_c1_g1~~TRINITY_DN3712_c1_g1_i1.p1  ORF type:complete len:1334 (+),score=268.36 TRINITY_DN3712_c1_g1_i1:48-4004(+)